MKKIIVIGGSGMVGYAVCQEALALGFEPWVVGRVNRSSEKNFLRMDLIEPINFDALNGLHGIDICINLAAITNHGQCESRPDLAQRLHVEVPKQLAKWAGDKGVKFVHMSTEAVYGYGQSDGGHREDETCGPKGVYAKTKFEGEQAVQDVNSDSLLIRATPVGFSPDGEGKTLFEWLSSELISGSCITGYADVLFSPVSSFDLAQVLVNEEILKRSGILNVGSSCSLSKYEFARLVCSSLGVPISRVLKGYSSKTALEVDGTLNSEKLVKVSGLELVSVQKMVSELVKRQSKITIR
ncbi:SDR family oxidoreductase [Persicirhabdus sediminis]|uniref:Sugar nucleotide-binding protein n=1 Tax=Persicirhabdus sediminis TaxID=454144 RepID=A0A8J7SM63_9BACT|nr:sugar nucleotide-binding protein [Persicirhabdus sediminis]MBK1792776.1 sugar nucleotide-binding protein [Persicirhabdus sediminis]